MRLKASVYGTPMAVLELPDTTCLGAACSAGSPPGCSRDLDDAARLRLTVPQTRMTRSRLERRTHRERRQLLYAAAYARLRPLHARLLDG